MDSRLLMAFLLFGSFLFCFLSVFDWTSGRPTKRVWGCMEAINAYQFQKVNGNSLKTLIKICFEDGIDLNGYVFDFSYLKHNLIEFSCPQLWEYLSAPKPLVALASYPGSGNTWTRELIQTTTGLHTGSIYKEWNFVGSTWCPTRKIFIVKTHLMSRRTNHPDCKKIGVSHLNYSKAIFILRNPYYALLAEFNRRKPIKRARTSYSTARENHAPSELFRSKEWETFVMKEAKKWKQMALYWLGNIRRPVFVLVYEKVRKNTLSEVYKLMTYLNISVPFNSLYCLSSNTTGNYRRLKPKWLTAEKLYDKKMRTMINTVIEDLNATVGLRRNITDILHSYLLPLRNFDNSACFCGNPSFTISFLFPLYFTTVTTLLTKSDFR